MKTRTTDWIGLANAVLSARNRLRSDALGAIDLLLRQQLDSQVREQVEQVRRVVADCANGLRTALKERRARP